jgi:hypothetical protein
MLVRRLDPDLFFKEVVDQFKQILTITKNNILVGIKKRLNFVDSSRVTWSITDNATNKSVDVGVSALHADTATTSTTASALADGDYGDIVVSGTGTAMSIDTNVVSDTKLRDSSALSVIGRSANSSGDPGDIAAVVDGDVLRRSGTTLGFGSIPESSVTNLVSDLAGKVPTSRTISTTTPLTGGGDLTANRTLAISDFSASGVGHARGAVPDPGAVSGSEKYLREDATWVIPVAPDYPRLPKNMWINPTTTLAIAKGNCYGFFYGKSQKRHVGSLVVRYEVTTASVGAGWVEVGVFTGDINPGTTPTLTRKGYTDISGTVNSTGIKETSITLTSAIDLEEDIWVVWASSAATTNPSLTAGDISVNNIIGFSLKSSVTDRPSTVASPSAFMAEDTTASKSPVALLMLS